MIVSFRDFSAPLLTMSGSAADLLQTCQIVAQQLDQAVPAADLGTVIAAIADDTLKEIVLDDVVVRQQILGACVSGDTAAVTAAQSRAQILDEAYLKQLGG